MTKQRKCIIFTFLILLFIFIFALNFYFLTRLNDEYTTKLAKDNKSIKNAILDQVLTYKLKTQKPVYYNKNPRYYPIRKKLIKSFLPKSYDNISIVWRNANSWLEENEVYPEYDNALGELIKAMQSETITKAHNSQRGTQLKLVLKLNGSQLVLFKPQWYKRTKIIDGLVYSGKDRHNSEIFAFYLGAVLNFRWTPIAVGRQISLKELYEKANTELKNTMTINDSQYCVYGKCFYCKESETVCGDENHIIEGVLLYIIPGTFNKHRSPWQRTYILDLKAPWEENDNYCDSLKEKLSKTRLLDLIDTSIFDYLIQNGDRHHYETRNNRILLLDNGKGFGNPNHDFIDILAPLYQCCMLRKTTWNRLLIFSGGALTEVIQDLSKNDELHPILTSDHYKSVERRLISIYTVVEYCKEKYGSSIFV